MTRTSLLAAVFAPVVLAALATPAGASPFGAVLVGPVIGRETGIGGTVGVRLGGRTPSGAHRWGGFGEATAHHFFGFGPHGDLSGFHLLGAGEWSYGGDALRVHAYLGGSLDRWLRIHTEADIGIATTALSGVLGVGATWGAFSLDVEAMSPTVELTRATDSPDIRGQLMLVFGAGKP